MQTENEQKRTCVCVCGSVFVCQQCDSTRGATVHCCPTFTVHIYSVIMRLRGENLVNSEEKQVRVHWVHCARTELHCAHARVYVCVSARECV